MYITVLRSCNGLIRKLNHTQPDQQKPRNRVGSIADQAQEPALAQSVSAEEEKSGTTKGHYGGRKERQACHAGAQADADVIQGKSQA